MSDIRVHLCQLLYASPKEKAREGAARAAAGGVKENARNVTSKLCKLAEGEAHRPTCKTPLRSVDQETKLVWCLVRKGKWKHTGKAAAGNKNSNMGKNEDTKQNQTTT